jgi:hypothetical protein
MTIPAIINKKWSRKAIGFFLYKIASFSGKPLFSDLLIERRNEMWRIAHLDIHSPDECEYTLFDMSTPLSEWSCCRLWQRKLSNKLNAKYFAEKLGVKVARLYWHGKEPAAIPFSTLPPAFVVKASEGWSSQHVWPISNNINLITGKIITRDDIVHFFQGIVSNPRYKNCYIIVEELLIPPRNEVALKDYKLFCFQSQVAYIQVIDRVNKAHSWYSQKWIPVKDQMHAGFHQGMIEPPPENLDEIISTAERLSRAYDFKFVRIDLYNTNRGVVFGEFTHTPWVSKSNKLFTPFANITFGELWQKEK